MADRKSFYTKSEGPNEQSLLDALKWLDEICNKNNYEKAFLAVNSASNLGGVIEEIIGRDVVSLLKKGGNVTLNGKTKITLVTERKLIFDAEDSPILAVYASKNFLDKLDGIDNISEILLVPWTLDEARSWIKTWNAIELGQPELQAGSPLIENKVVEESLKSLIGLINKSTGIKHPNDRSRTIELFEILKNEGEIFNPEEIKSWLIAKGGLKPEDADEIADVATKVIEGRKLRRSKGNWAKNVIELWRLKTVN